MIILFSIIGFTIQTIAVLAFRKAIIDYNALTKYMIFSVAFGIISNFLIARIIPQKLKLLKLLFLTYATAGIISFTVFWIVEFVKLFM